MLPILDRSTEPPRLVAYYDPDSYEVRSPKGHLLFYYNCREDTVITTSHKEEVVLSLRRVRETTGMFSGTTDGSLTRP